MILVRHRETQDFPGRAHLQRQPRRFSAALSACQTRRAMRGKWHGVTGPWAHRRRTLPAWSARYGSARSSPGTVGMAAYTGRAPRRLDAHGRPGTQAVLVKKQAFRSAASRAARAPGDGPAPPEHARCGQRDHLASMPGWSRFASTPSLTTRTSHREETRWGLLACEADYRRTGREDGKGDGPHAAASRSERCSWQAGSKIDFRCDFGTKT